jgi:uncharacterized membrane protein
VDVEVARAIHVLAVVLWIGGVGFVTTVVLPELRRGRAPADRLAAFAEFENRFARQARVYVLLAGLAGLYMVARMGLWPAFAMAAYWWLDAMVALWLLFAFVLFVAEPLFLDRWLEMRARARPAETFRLVERLHWLILVLSCVVVLAGVAGAHGLL